ncbi:MAG: NUDIX hydrolase [Deltaproteobacteria bacterium]|nr:NUDIX hydrolase [Deltaproteobacteria bacterium]
MIPRSILTLLREVGRHVLRHPVPGVAAAAHTKDGRWLLVRRADTGTWCLPGGTLEWGETLAASIVREIAEETGARVLRVERLVGVYSRPDRDLRFHAVTTVVSVLVDASALKPLNPLEIREARLFAPEEIPWPLAYAADDLMRDAMASAQPVFE